MLNLRNKMKKQISFLLMLALCGTFLTGCFQKPAQQNTGSLEPVQLVYWKLYDEEDVINPLIQQYQAQNPTVSIRYRKFQDAEEYYDLLLNELAEGEGPDIFSVPNYWLARNSRKLTPMPPSYYDPAFFEETFVSVAAKDAILTDSRDGVRKVHGLPLTVDTLALYYNKDLFEDRVPERGRPADTWDEFKDDVFKLTKSDNSFERFEVAGVAMGRADNISLAADILYMLMLQYKVNFYNQNFTQAQFASQQATTSFGATITPAIEAMKLYTSCGLASQKNYSWNQYIADSGTDAKEIDAFAIGKVASMFGYSYHYDLIQDRMADLNAIGINTIDPSVIRIAPVPQVNDPETSTQKRDVFANYFVETVARTSQNPEVAWDFLIFLTEQENMRFYNEKTNRPTSRRDLIEEQQRDSTYGVFAEQVGFAESLVIYDWSAYAKIFMQAISDVIATETPQDVVRSAQDAVNELIPDEGVFPPITGSPPEENEEVAEN